MDMRMDHQYAPREHRFVRFDAEGRAAGKTFAAAGWLLDRLAEMQLDPRGSLLAWIGPIRLFHDHVLPLMIRQAEARGMRVGAVSRVRNLVMIDGREIRAVSLEGMNELIGLRLDAVVIDLPEMTPPDAAERAERRLRATAERDGAQVAFVGPIGGFAHQVVLQPRARGAPA